MIIIQNKQNCTACKACLNACPVNCIGMISDDEGFLYPSVDTSKCTGCGKCESVCPTVSAIKASELLGAYAAVNKDELTRMNSSSGGLFAILAGRILKNNGVVFGACFDRDFKVIHSYADSEESAVQFRGSKYVQSDIGGTYHQAQAFLEQGRPVLYSGTPCQIAGLKAYLGKDYSNLYCLDIICHGVPSAKTWELYIKYLEQKYASKIIGFSFRDKEASGWLRYSIKACFQSGKTYCADFFDDPYMRFYLQNISLRPACYACCFKGNRSVADITLADFWGVQKLCPDFFDNKGTSLALIRSVKGLELFNSVNDKLSFRALDDIDSVLAYNSAATQSVSSHPQRASFFKDMDGKSFRDLMRIYCRKSSFCKLKKRAISLIKRVINTN